MKAIARIPPSLRGCATFSPDMGFVQPGSFFDFGLRFRPESACLERCVRNGWGIFVPGVGSNGTRNSKCDIEGGVSQYLEGEASSSGQAAPGDLSHTTNADKRKTDEQERAGVISIPITFEVPGQVLPAQCILQARLTGWRVDVDCSGRGRVVARGTDTGNHTVDFGSCFVGQSVIRVVALRNTALLPVKFGFVGSAGQVKYHTLCICGLEQSACNFVHLMESSDKKIAVCQLAGQVRTVNLAETNIGRFPPKRYARDCLRSQPSSEFYFNDDTTTMPVKFFCVRVNRV